MHPTQPLSNQLSPELWWDVDARTLEEDAHAHFIIRRVMERGRREDVYQVWDHYGADRVNSALISAPTLSARTLNFFAHQFKLPASAFRAHQHKSVTWSS